MQQQPIKIVSLVWYKILPANFGGQQTIAAFIEAMSKQLPIVCLCSKNNQATGKEGFTIAAILPTNKLQFVNPLIWYKILKYVKKEAATHVIVEHPYHVIAARLLQLLYSIKIIHYSHNIEYQRFKLLGKRYWPFIYLAEKWIGQFAVLNIFVTNEDKALLIEKCKLIPNNCITIPHIIVEKAITEEKAAGKKIRSKHQIPEHHAILLFNGTLDYLPNAKAVEDIAHCLLPALNAIQQNFTIIINGRIEEEQYFYLKNINHPQIVITGFVENVQDYFLAANVYINAVTIGGGVQTKTLEALSYHKNVVCFSHMLNGIDMKLVGEKIYAVNNWQDFAEKTFLAITDTSLTPNSFFEAFSYTNNLNKLMEKLRN